MLQNSSETQHRSNGIKATYKVANILIVLTWTILSDIGKLKYLWMWKKLRLKLVVATVGRPKQEATDPRIRELNKLLEINHRHGI